VAATVRLGHERFEAFAETGGIGSDDLAIYLEGYRVADEVPVFDPLRHDDFVRVSLSCDIRLIDITESEAVGIPVSDKKLQFGDDLSLRIENSFILTFSHLAGESRSPLDRGTAPFDQLDLNDLRRPEEGETVSHDDKKERDDHEQADRQPHPRKPDHGFPRGGSVRPGF